MIKISLILFIMCSFSVKAEFYTEYKDTFCKSNEFNCKRDGSIDPYVEDKFFQQLFFKIDEAYSNLGFTDVKFLVCRDSQGTSGGNCYRDVTGIDFKKNKWVYRGNYVTGNKYKITKQYPVINKEVAETGVYFYRTLKESEMDEFCTNEYKTGLRPKSFANSNEMKFSDIFKSYANKKVFLRILLENFKDFDPIKILSSKTECLIINERVFIPRKVNDKFAIGQMVDSIFLPSKVSVIYWGNPIGKIYGFNKEKEIKNAY